MKHLLIISMFLLFFGTSYSQTYDLIINIKNDSIACRIDSVSESNIYFEMKNKREWIKTNLLLSNINSYKYDVIEKKKTLFKRGSSYLMPYDLLPPNEKLNISFFIPAFSLSGPKYDLKSGMVSAGMDAEAVSDPFIGSSHDVKYPTVKQKFFFDFEALYFIGKSGFSFNAGIADNIEIHGLKLINNSPYDTPLYLTLTSRIVSYSLNYAYTSLNRRHYIILGPAYLFYKLESNPKDAEERTYHFHKPGLYLGYCYQIVQSKNWFLNFKTNFRWASNLDVGPFKFYYEATDFTGTEKIYSIDYPSVNMNLICINVGLSVGFRVGQ